MLMRSKLQKGFSLFEMLIALTMTSLIMLGVTEFFPQLQLSIMNRYQAERLEQSIRGALSGLIKDARRAGFIAKEPSLITGSGIEINAAKNCIIFRYDLNTNSKWDNQPGDAKNSDIFAYRKNKNDFEIQRGITHCAGTGWEKIIDPNEIKVSHFLIEQKMGYLLITMTANLKKNTNIAKTILVVVKHENG